MSWAGQDDSGGSGIATYSVFVSDNGGAFQPWVTNTTATSATFTGSDGHTYGFYSVATDNAGNVQPTPSSAQATTTLQAIPPSSSVAALPPFSHGSFTVSWSGSDIPAGLGIAGYSVFVSDNGGPYQALVTNTTSTSTTFTGQDGHTYRFYSIATDHIGNIQPTPSSPQATTEVDTSAPTSSVSTLPAFSPVSFTVSWSGTDKMPGSGLATYNVFVSEDDGSYKSLETNTTLTSTTFTGQSGHTYGFYSIATDNEGNEEIAPSSAQTTTTVDGVAPTSSVLALPATSLPSFTVSWSGQDNPGGSGLASYDIYESTNGGTSWTLWQNQTTTTSAVLNGVLNTSYEFYSVAVDNVGNREVKTPIADARTQTPVVQTTLTDLENTTTPPAAKITSMLSGVYHDTDKNSNPGIAVFGLIGNGSWQYFNGTTWTNIPAVSVTKALLLPQKDQLRFVPAALWNGQADLLYVAWDGSVGSAGGFANPAPVPGSPFSSNAGLVVVTVTPAAHAPGWTAVSTTLPPVQPGSANLGVTVQQAFGSVFMDPTAGQPASIAVTGLTGNGTWQYALYNSTTKTVGSFQNMPKVSASVALLLGSQDMILFLPKSNGFTGMVSLQVHAWDGTGTVSDGATTNLSKTTSVGGKTPFSSAVLTGKLYFNDAPTQNASGLITLPSIVENTVGKTVSVASLLKVLKRPTSTRERYSAWR